MTTSLDSATVIQKIRAAVPKEKKIVFVSGNFTILHPGHLRLLRFAAERGDYLVVGVYGDNITQVSVSEKHRLENLDSISWVKLSFILREPVEVFLEQLRPDVVVKGKEHETQANAELDVLSQYGGQLIFGSGELTFSSLDLLRKEFYGSTTNDISLPTKYLERHEIENKTLVNLLDRLRSVKVCVIGDLIIDEYITCEPLGMSQEDPTIVVTPVDSSRFIGGAGIVAAHAAGLGAQVDLLSVKGSDSIGEFAQTGLAEAGVNAYLIEDESRPTTLKQRFRSKGKSLLRVSHLHQTAISPALQEQLLSRVESVIQNTDLIVFSDFNYGCLPQQLVEKISNLARSNNVMLVADSQSSSQVGDISRFSGMDLITPTEREARISTRNHEDGLVILAEQIKQQSSARNVLLKLGEEGLLIHAGNNKNDDWLTDRLGAMNATPKDVAGAGDSLLITAALAFACGSSIWEASFLGTLAAAIQVGRLGNTPLQSKELLQEIK
jgi:rfaE bifunctional protein kinase chain/domain